MIFTKLFIKKIISLILCFSIICSLLILGGCGAENFSIYFGISQMPKNVDPQKAQSQAELLAVRNCFRGLFKQDANGNTVDIFNDLVVGTTTIADSAWTEEDAANRIFSYTIYLDQEIALNNFVLKSKQEHTDFGVALGNPLLRIDVSDGTAAGGSGS